MMSRRRSLFTFGALLVAAVLLVPSAVFAQATTLAATGVTNITYNSVKLTWTRGDTVAASGWEILYQMLPDSAAPPAGGPAVVAESTLDFVAGTAMTEMVSGGTPPANGYTLTGLTPGKVYMVGIAGLSTADPPVRATVSDRFKFKALAAPMPDPVTGVMVKPGDMSLMVSWDKPYGGTASNGMELGIKAYHVQYRTSQTASMGAGDWLPKDLMQAVVMAPATETTITGLTNGTMYDVQVEAKNELDATSPNWSRVTDDTRGTPSASAMTETPALPLVGILLLGAGLVTAGRRRLRQ